MIAIYFWIPDRSVWLVEACLLVVLGMGAVQIALLSDHSYRPWYLFVVVSVEFCIIGIAMFGGQFLFDPPWSPQTLLDNGTVI